jgi:deoxyribodipyrimidine photolyase-related protein
MGPNVYGMGLMSDGGVFATKPYIAGSNYVRKMSDYAPGFWCDIMDGLYWRFIEKHQAFFAGNPRLAVMPKALAKLEPERKKRIFAAAEAFIRRNTVAA